MLTTAQIKERATREHTSDTNIAREYCQHVLLSALYQQSAARHLYFKGGTALRMLYRSPRFSEDLDFDAPAKQRIRELEDALTAALADVEALGISTDLTEAKRTNGGYLAAAVFTLADFKIVIQLEISLRRDAATGEVTTVENEYVPTYTLVQLAEQQLVTGKIAALLNRRKPRDFYDCYFMLRAQLIPAEQRSLLPKVLQALREAQPAFASELRAFLPRSHWTMVKDLPSALEREIQRFM